LFLLDEPDTHLNPVWGMQYLQTLKTIADTGNDGQIIIATHDPLMIAGLRKQQVLVLERDGVTGRIVSQHPEIDPRGMGVSGILKSSMFGLRTTLDLPTQAKLDERFELAAKGTRSEQEDARLKQLSEELADDGFAQDFRDDNYQRYATAVAKVRAAGRLFLTREEIRQIDDEALAAVKKLSQEVTER
jgi:ABC-type multidrug transport system ATPase subunit